MSCIYVLHVASATALQPRPLARHDTAAVEEIRQNVHIILAHLDRSPVYLHGLVSGLYPLLPSDGDQTANSNIYCDIGQ